MGMSQLNIASARKHRENCNSSARNPPPEKNACNQKKRAADPAPAGRGTAVASE